MLPACHSDTRKSVPLGDRGRLYPGRLQDLWLARHLLLTLDFRVPCAPITTF
jgi:hypothetical protein